MTLKPSDEVQDL